MVKVIVDMALCQSHGECVVVSPDLFELGDDDVLRWQEQVEDSRRAELEEAANLCPMMAIALED